MSKKTVTNTATKDPRETMAEAFVFGPSQAIERSEAIGQQELVESDTLPNNIEAESKVALEASGLVFGELVPGDDLFRYVTLPAGWSKRCTDHAMHSELLDEQGRVRARMFYKAAFYDRGANMHAVARFRIESEYDQTTHDQIAVHVKDGDTTLHSVAVDRVERDQRDRAYWSMLDARRREAEAWLETKYPDWRNVGAYWSTP